MANSAAVFIHPSQFPEALSRQWRESLRARRMPHKFLYDTPRQAAAWLRVHEALSPARRDATCERMYEAAFQTVAERLAGADSVDLISLGSGGGQKDAALLRAIRLKNPPGRCCYVPVDVSPSLGLVSRAAAMAVGVTPEDCTPLIADLALVDDWEELLSEVSHGCSHRVVCFFGMLPNFEPPMAFARLAALARPDDMLLVSANLAPGADYPTAVEQILPQYDNPPTREWLLGCLVSLGIERTDGLITFSTEACPHDSELRRIKADFTFAHSRTVTVEGEEFVFAAGEVFPLFFSYRYTPERLQNLGRQHALEVVESWSNAAGDEGLFLMSRSRERSRA